MKFPSFTDKHTTSVLREILQTTKAYSELAGRTQPLVTDVLMTFTELGECFIIQDLFRKFLSISKFRV